MRLKPNNGHVLTLIFSIFNRGLNPNTLQVFKKMLGSPYKARGLIVVRTGNNKQSGYGSGAFLTPGSGMGRKSGSGTGICFFFGLKYFNSLMGIRDGDSSERQIILADLGSPRGKSAENTCHKSSPAVV